MGLFFSNIHIKKNNSFSVNSLIDMLRDEMKQKGFNELPGAEGAEISLCIYYPENSAWVSVASDCYDFGNAESAKSAAIPFSERFGTDVIAAMCMDSDYLMMNLVNVQNNIDGWINSGELYGGILPRKTCIAPWKSVVSDFDEFSSIVNEDRVYSEETFYKSAALLGMDVDQCALSSDGSGADERENLRMLYFSPSDSAEQEPPVLEIARFNLVPCSSERAQVVFVNNKGGSSKGVAVMFWGGYVENDEVVIERATFESDYGSKNRRVIPITSKKVKASSGETVLYWEDRDFVIPKTVDQSLPWSRVSDLEFERQFGVRFYVSGNKRKFLDVKVTIIPLENRKGSDTWYVYRPFKTKKRFIEQINEDRRRINENGGSFSMIDPDDYDL